MRYLPLAAILLLIGCEPGDRPNGTDAPDVMEAPAVEQHEDADTVFLDPDD